MRGLRQALAVWILMVTSLLAWPASASACICQGYPSSISAPEYRQWLASFNGVVFRGTVVSDPAVVEPPRGWRDAAKGQAGRRRKRGTAA